MTTTQRPFLAAYRNAAEPAHFQPGTPGSSPFPADLNSSQVVITPAYSGEGESTWARQPESASQREGVRPRTKRPLASFLHNFEPVSTPTPAPARPVHPKWPTLCLELLAGATSSYDQIIANLDSPGRVGRLTGVLGAGPGQGTTTTAICLALRIAAHGISTLLVDADLQQAQLAAQLEVRPAVPWLSLLREGAAVTDAVVPSENVGVDVLLNEPTERTTFDPWARFHAGNAAGQMRRRYQQTVIDLGHDPAPALELASALAIDDLILVCGPQSTLHDQEQLYQAATAHGQHVAAILRAA